MRLLVATLWESCIHIHMEQCFGLLIVYSYGQSELWHESCHTFMYMCDYESILIREPDWILNSESLSYVPFFF